MHTVRYKAQRHASSVRDGEANWNPFARVRSNQSVPKDIESSPRRRSADLVPTVDEETRRAESRQAEQEFPGPHHHPTEPSPTTSGHVRPFEKEGVLAEAAGSSSPHIGASKESTDISDKTAVESRKPRQRIRNIFRKSVDDTEHPDLEHRDSESVDQEERKRRSHKRKIPVMQQVKAVVFGSWINVLLVFVPVGFAVEYAHVKSPVLIFTLNFIAIIPLAGMLSYATEELALRVGETMGGLLNASFGNAVELIVSIQALIKNEITIVKTSLIGSMLSNLLLVMGMSFFLGGMSRLEQYFNITVAQTAASMLALSIASVIIPTVFHQMLQADTSSPDGSKNQELSRGTAVILLFVYGCYLYFQLSTHAAIYNEPSKKVAKKKSSKIEEGRALRGVAAIGAGTAAATGGGVNANKLVKNQEELAEEEDDFEEPQLSIIGALITLGLSTTLVAFCSEFMVSSIDGLTSTGGISTTFVGLILLPIVGNAAEHATAVTVAIKDKMDLAIGVAVGSSMQIALLVLPFIVVLGWILGKTCMTLFFDTFQVAVLFVAVLLVNYLIQDGKSHWLEGVLLMSSYFIIALAAWFYPNIAEQC